MLADCEGTPDVLLIASGSEVEICMQAKDELASENIKAKVISMVSIEKFEQQDEEYRDSVINRDVRPGYALRRPRTTAGTATAATMAKL